MPNITQIPSGSAPDTRLRDATSKKIIQAAYQCFSAFGVEKTGIADIAAKADVSRTTVYNYFSGLDDIVNQICADESLRMNVEIKEKAHPQGKVEDVLTDCMLLVVRMAQLNPYVRMFLESVRTASISADPASIIHRAQHDRWDWLLEPAMKRGDLSDDLDLDEIVSWLTLSLEFLLIKTEAVKMDDRSLGYFIRRFVVEPILSNHSLPASTPGGSLKARSRSIKKGNAQKRF